MTTQNSDAEWSDGRQAYLAPTLFEYYTATRELEYLERGVAALRAGFAVAPFENYAHTGGGPGNGSVFLCCGDRPGELSSPNWGVLSSAASLEFVRSRGWRDAYVDTTRGHAVGINGCTLRLVAVNTSAHVIALEVATEFVWQAPLELVAVVRQTSSIRWRLAVNGHVPLGPFTPAELREGVKIPPGDLL